MPCPYFFCNTTIKTEAKTTLWWCKFMQLKEFRKTIPVLLSKSFSQPIMLFSEKQLNLQEQRLCAIFAIEIISVKNITN